MSGPGPSPARVADSVGAELLVFHWLLMLGCAAVVLASMVLTASPDAVLFFGTEIPPTCVIKRFTGMDCLGCGLTRSFVYMGHLELMQAFTLHKLGPLLYLLTLTQPPYRAWRLWQLRRRG